jgi:hypothetical protein
MKIMLIISFFLVSTASMASDYPPGYPVESQCQTQGSVEVCAKNHHSGSFPRLSIHYDGHVLKPKKSAYVKLNDQAGVFKFTDEHNLYLNEPVSYRCWAGGLPESYTGPYVACNDKHLGSEGELVWEVKSIPPSETNLFLHAQNDQGLPMAWAIEIAVVDELGQWDSIFGQNYQFLFE